MPRLKRPANGFDPAAALAGLTIDRGQSIAPQIYAGLRHRIIDGRLPAGAPIHEAVIADAIDVSRTPLRAALQQLAGEGLIETRPQVGSLVAPKNRARFLEALLIRAALEAQVVRRLAMSGLDEVVLKPIMARQQAAAAIDDYRTFFDIDEEFHAALAAMAGMPNAWAIAQSVKAHVDRERFLIMSSIRGRSERAWRDHLKILAAIRAGDPDGAAAAMTSHVESVLDVPAEPAIPEPAN